MNKEIAALSKKWANTNDFIKRKNRGNARKLLPHLVEAAKKRRTIAYSELEKKTGIDAYYQIPRALGYIRDEITEKYNYPLLNCIVVNRMTGKPGRNWLPNNEHLSDEEDDREFVKRIREVFEYEGWDEFLAKYGSSDEDSNK